MVKVELLGSFIESVDVSSFICANRQELMIVRYWNFEDFDQLFIKVNDLPSPKLITSITVDVDFKNGGVFTKYYPLMIIRDGSGMWNKSEPNFLKQLK